MIPFRNIKSDYKLSGKELELAGVEGLRVPNNMTLQGHMFVYFKKDIEWLANFKNRNVQLQNRSNSAAQERRRAELIELLETKYGVKD